MAPRDPEAKRRQLLEAALAEFAEYGVAGARIDRIATRAGCSAGLVYTYFGSKEELFEAVFDLVVVQAAELAPITPDDLPGYAGKLFDAQEAHPEVMRLATWHRLERSELIAVTVKSNQHKADVIRAAQEAGVISKRFDAEQLLMLIINTASLWSLQPREFTSLVEGDRDYRRATVVAAVRRLVEL
jgi:AcrR family transcriptional regulator